MSRVKIAVALVVAITAAGAALGMSWLAGEKSAPREVLTVEKKSFKREVPADGTLKAEKATPVTSPPGRERLKIAWIKENGSAVKKGEVVVRFARDEFEKNLADGKSDLGVARAKLKGERVKLKQAASARERAAHNAEIDLGISRQRSTEQEGLGIFSQNEIVQSRIDGELSEARVKHARKAGSIDSSISRSKLQLLELESKKAQIAISIAEKGLERMEVTAPHDGIFVYEWPGLKSGDLIYPGMSFANLPLVDKMEAEVFVLEADAMGLEEGKPATVVIESQPHKRYAAKIKKVDKIAKRRQRDVPIQYFAVTLELETTDPAVMKPGQRVRASLELDSADSIVVPRHCIFTVDGDSIAYRLEQGEFVAVEVKLGAGTPGLVVVEEGLSEGDAIATRDPFAADKQDKEEDSETPSAEKGGES
jgi:hypothetical protein